MPKVSEGPADRPCCDDGESSLDTLTCVLAVTAPQAAGDDDGERQYVDVCPSPSFATDSGTDDVEALEGLRSLVFTGLSAVFLYRPAGRSVP